ncbi:MAG: hypothetical protein Q4P18_04850 [Methanobrevibacter sp.]|uniref:hypothetical protein n=1 Tax=Methanobrevibacter sp. TaxID=66852 RepID=UPI0026DFF979|nr:hypothetical protein [Methanobrevibacter sp.]MDO5848840.1 hypothetical protein [Methanobrevibacter sp.]
MSYEKPQDGLYVFDSKADFAEFYAEHKETIDEKVHTDAIELKFECPNGKIKIADFGKDPVDIDQLLDDMPDGVKTELIENVRVLN